MAGFELLAQIAKEREQAVQDEIKRQVDDEFREGIPTSLWRCLLG